MKFRNQNNRVASSGAFFLFTFLFLFASAALSHAGDYTCTTNNGAITTNNGAITITKYTGSGGSVTIPNTIDGLPVTSIGDFAFINCSSLTSITIPNSVTSIGDEVFYGCTSLTNLIIGESVTTIGSAAFSYCTNLTSVNIPNGVTTIGASAFSSCTRMTNVTVDTSNSEYASQDGVLFNKSKTTLIRCPVGMTGAYTIPKSVTTIGNNAFSSCSSLTGITIPNRVTDIRVGAFSYCTNLTSVTIPDSVTSIGYWAFSCCSSLTGITIPNRVTDIGSEAFSYCTSLTNVAIPDMVTSIGYRAFYGCTSLTRFTVDPSNSEYASQDGVLFNKSKTTLIQCPGGMTSVNIPNSVTRIGDEAFYGCTSLTRFTVDPSNSEYASQDGVLFNKSKTTLIRCPVGMTGAYTIPKSVTTIGNNAFSSCSSLASVNIPSSVTSIGDSAFSYCTSLTGVAIPDSVTNIGNWEFYGCSSLAIVTIPNSVTSIGQSMFFCCTNLASVNIPNSVTSIGVEAFSYCTSLSFITIPYRVTSIGFGAFSYCASLSFITIPNSVWGIDNNAFSGCSKLKTVFFQGNAPFLGLDAFYGATKATIYVLPGTTGWGPTYGGRPTALWNTYTQWAQSIGLATQYPNASAESDDADLDGANNLAEMRAGTDPTNPNSALKFETTPRPADLTESDKTPVPTDRHALYIQTVPGKTYTIQATDALGGQWQTKTTAAATTAQKRILLTKPATQRFYRVLIQQ